MTCKDCLHVEGCCVVDYYGDEGAVDCSLYEVCGAEAWMVKRMDEREKEVILAYAANNMNRSAAARQIYMSRSGMSLWLDNVKRDTGLDPRNFYDLIKLVALCKEGVKDG